MGNCRGLYFTVSANPLSDRILSKLHNVKSPKEDPGFKKGGSRYIMLNTKSLHSHIQTHDDFSSFWRRMVEVLTPRIPLPP